MYNNIQLVKTSVFFLSHWTLKLQRNIALKLIRKIYSPEEVLLQTPGQEKIYILDRGKVDIQANFCGGRKLSTLEVDPKKVVFFNVYGYSALISGLKINLRAVASDYSICYLINRETLL